ncbi:hypothetical protein DYST_02778 [Dyella terrae]|nr:hypothetical protein DYST_02778 [Dyella terrae]
MEVRGVGFASVVFEAGLRFFVAVSPDWPLTPTLSPEGRGSTACAPTRNFATSSIGFCVADKPMRSKRRWHSDSNRSSDSARCAPRLLDAMAWISSTITVRVAFSIARPDSEPSRMYSDSGVVTRMCGGCLRIPLRSACGVSPVRTAVRMSTSGRPSLRSSARMPSSGASRLMRMSLESAFSGDT